jgi:hypothetical protein
VKPGIPQVVESNFGEPVPRGLYVIGLRWGGRAQSGKGEQGNDEDEAASGAHRASLLIDWLPRVYNPKSN